MRSRSRIGATPFVALLAAACGFGVPSEGTPFDAARARAVLGANRELLAQVKALRTLHPETDAGRLESLSKSFAKQLGALWIRVEPSGGERTVMVCFFSCGLPETYWSLLQWVPPATIERVQSEGLRLGEDWTDLGDGWFWVWK